MPQHSPFKVFFLDDHPAIVNVLKTTFSTDSTFEIVGEAHNITAAIAYLAVGEIELLITDLHIGQHEKGLDFIQAVRQQNPEVRIIVYSMLESPDVFREMVSQKVNGYVLKRYDEKEVLKAAKCVMAGEHYFSAELVLILAQPDKSSMQAKLNTLTDKERAVMQALVNDMTTEAIAAELGMSPSTVATHRQKVLSKLGVNSIVGLVYFCYELGLVPKRSVR